MCRIRNVIQEEDCVALEVRSKYWLANQVVFKAESRTAAAHLVASLPHSSSPGFSHKWTAVRDFNTRLRSVEETPIITPTLVTIAILVFAGLCTVTKRWGDFDLQTLINWGANFGPLTVNGQWWRLVSALFLHINLPHLLFNMWALWNVGRLCERIFGRFIFAFLYLSCGVIGSLASVVWNPAQASAGASGAIFGVFGAFLAFYFKPGNQVPSAIARRHWVSTSAFALFSLVDGALHPGIDNAAHVGGLISGFVLGWILARPLELGSRRTLPTLNYLGAISCIAFVVVISIGQVRGIGSELTGPEKYWQQHGAYVVGESKNLELWNELASKAATGTMSDLELGKRFQNDILPFWESAQNQIDKENLTLQGPTRPYALLVADFVRLRYEWALKIVTVVKTRDPKLLAELQSDGQKSNMAQARLERLSIQAQMIHRPRALSTSSFVTKIRNAITGYQWQCVHQPNSWAPIPVATDNPKDGPSERNRVGCLAQQLFMTGEFAELDALLDRYASDLADLPDGSSHYEGVVAALKDLFEFGGIDGLNLLGRTADWRRSVQSSRRPDLLEAMIFQSTAWSARGHGFANSVSAQALAQFAYRLEMASAALLESKVALQNDPAWYSEQLSVELDQGQLEDLIRATFDEGFERFPKYRPLERGMLRALMPRWGGSYDKVDHFINDVAEKAGSSRRAERYAELYSEYALMEGDDVDFFDDTAADWGRMQLGYRMRVVHHPTSDLILNLYAVFACRAGDRDEYPSIRSSIDKRYSSVAWTEKYSRDFCDKKFSDLNRAGGTASETQVHGEEAQDPDFGAV